MRASLEGEPKLQNVWVMGEVSNLRPSQQGHLYFTLKDERSSLRCVIWSSALKGRKVAFKDGERVLAFGSVGIYERGGEYNLVVSDFAPYGAGLLAAKIEELKRKLHAEGLFDASRKIPLPPFPLKVAVITSPTTAALQDVIKVWRRRAPFLEVVVFPAVVQGDTAPPSIISALANAHRVPGVDLIVVVRGGGSIEDLWCFNDETLARAIAKRRIPVLTGIGHEIDTTIADLVADRSAPTPSAAAEVATPDFAEIRGDVEASSRYLADLAVRNWRQMSERLAIISRNRVLVRVRDAVDDYARRIESHKRSLSASPVRYVVSRADNLTRAFSSVLIRRVLDRIGQASRTVDDWAEAIANLPRERLEGHTRALVLVQAKLDGVDPNLTLKRGYTLTFHGADERLASRAAQVQPGEKMRVKFFDGEVGGKADE